MENREFKDSVYQSISGLIKSLANPHRLEILEILSNGEKTVEEISKETDMSFANASQHLQNLKRAKWVKHRREKNFVYYDIMNPYVYAIWKTMREVARIQTPEIDNTIDSFRKVLGIRSTKYSDLATLGSYQLIDARPHREYQKGHLNGALSIHDDAPLPSETLVVYSRGPLCSLADETTHRLQEEGHQALRLEEGYRDLAK